MTVKKYILTLIIAITLPFATKAQTFVEGSVGYIPFEENSGDIPSHGGISMQFQYGKFVTNYKMRSVSLTVNKLEYNNPDISYTSINGVTGNFHSTINTRATAYRLGYERKGTFGNSEFDDTWQYYNIVNYHLTMLVIKESYSDPKVVFQDKRSAGTYISPDIEFGLGMGRKFNQKAYLYTEARIYMPLIGELIYYTGIGFRFNAGVRYFIR